MENLLPAGNREALERAIACGADAVYLGYSAFSARAGAGNFDEQALKEAVALAHLHHVRVHVTVNTLIKDSEMEAAMQVISMLASLHVDAVLIQDLGLLRMVRRCYPGLPVHASTQMTIHNASGVRLMKQLGVTRVVLARECSLQEIRRCCEQGIEIEVFGHGAQCVCVSGQCLFSSAIGGRSGNRGRCAQPCRLQYTFSGEKGAWLSPRDVCLRDDLDSLQSAGVDSVKMEGRLKRPEYVSVVASVYRNGLDSLEAGQFRKADPGEREALDQIFQRGGFMRGYSQGCEDAAVIDPEHVSHTGVRLGTVRSVHAMLAEVLLEKKLNDQDELQFGGRGGEMIYAGPSVEAGSAAKVRLRPGLRVQPGDPVMRLTSSEQLRQAMAVPLPQIRVSGELIAYPGREIVLRLSDDTVSAEVTGPVLEPATSRALSEEDARRSLGKMGDTPFVLETLKVRTEQAFVPVSVLNQLRRQALDALTRARIAAFEREAGCIQPADAYQTHRDGCPEKVVVSHAAGATHDCGNALAVWEPLDYRPEALEKGMAELKAGSWFMLPMFCEENTLQMLHDFVHRHQEHLGGVMLNNVGQLGLQWPLRIAAGPGIPVMNRRAWQFLEEAGCSFAVLSQELDRSEVCELTDGNESLLVPAYGRMQLMLLKHCPARTVLGCRTGHAECTLCDRNDARSLKGKTLKDRLGVEWPLERVRLPEGCMVRLMDARILDLRKEVQTEGRHGFFVMNTSAQEASQHTQGHWKSPVL